MKKTMFFHPAIFVGCAAAMLTIYSCKKEAGIKPQPAAETMAAVVVADNLKSNDISKAISPFGILGKYNDRGSRTVYRGQENGDNVIVSIDYFNEKKVVPALDTKSLVCGYGETNYVNMGWQYVIRYNLKKNEIVLSPNAVMAAAIQPGSFESRFALYDAATHTFNFLTRFTDKNGNENEVFDILTKE